jgi:hypothetical protein
MAIFTWINPAIFRIWNALLEVAVAREDGAGIEDV